MLAVADPVAAGEFVEQRTVEAARRPEVGILDHRILAQPGLAQPRPRRLLSRAVTSRSSSRPSQSSRVRSAAAGVVLHFEERIGHGGQAEAAQPLGQGVDQHRLSFQW